MCVEAAWCLWGLVGGIGHGIFFPGQKPRELSIPHENPDVYLPGVAWPKAPVVTGVVEVDKRS